MTGQRASAVWKMEKEFGVHDTSTNIWQRFGPALNITWTAQNNTNKFYSIGSKFWDTTSGGRFSGTLTINTLLDYSNIGYLLLAFEDYSYNATTGTHTFQKRNGKRVPSFTIRNKVLNRMVGGPTDEDKLLLGCVISSIDFSQEASSSASVAVKMTGFYTWETTVLSDLEDTDYEEFNGDMVEWLCLQIPPGTTIANVDKLSFSVNNKATVQSTTCSRRATDYYEGTSEFGFSATVYSTDPTTFYQRFYSGGYSQGLNEPLKKGLKPIPAVRIVTTYNDGSTDYESIIDLSNVTVDSMPRTENPTQKLTDNPTFSAQNLSIRIKSPIGSLAGLLP